MPAPIGAVVYRRRQHVINLFVAQTAEHGAPRGARIATLQGFNIRRWSDRGLNFWAVSDLGADELADFGEKFEARCEAATSLRSATGPRASNRAQFRSRTCSRGG